MNKKVIRILFILILCVITIPFSVNAATYKIKLDDNGGKGGSGTI